jgi:ubiquitin C-terminal hydrolase
MSKHLKNINHTYSDKEMLYDLYGIVNHLGATLSSGHYISDCYNEENNSWYNFNDTTVTKIVCDDDEALKKRLCSGDNYVLFYKRKDFKCESE